MALDEKINENLELVNKLVDSAEAMMTDYSNYLKTAMNNVKEEDKEKVQEVKKMVDLVIEKSKKGEEYESILSKITDLSKQYSK